MIRGGAQGTHISLDQARLSTPITQHSQGGLPRLSQHMRFFLLLLVTVFTLSAQLQPALAVNEAQDFYFVVDTSGSIDDNDSTCKDNSDGLTCMQLLANFCEDTATAMAKLVGSYYEDQENNGIRIGITLFRCMNEDSDPNVILEPTGNKTLIDKAFQKLYKIKPTGQTCAETALNQTLHWIEEAEALAPPTRTSSVLYVTDGFLNSNANQDTDSKRRSEAIADEINAENNTQIFAIVLSDGFTAKKKKRQIEEVTEITGDENLIFPVDSVNALNNTINSLTAFIYGDFSIALVKPDSSRGVCAGERPSIQVTGSSVSEMDNLICSFTLSGNPSYTYPDVDPTAISGGYLCETPISFYSSPGTYETITVQLINVEPTIRRLVGTSTFQLSRPSCITATPVEAERCIGDDISYELTNATIDAIINSTSSFDVNCIIEFENDGYSYTRTVAATLSDSEDSFLCTLSDESITQFLASGIDTSSVTLTSAAISSVQVAPPPMVSNIQVEISLSSGDDIPGTDATSLTYSDLYNVTSALSLDAASCLASKAAISACWRMDDEASATFSGEAVEWARSQAESSSSLNLQCLIGMYSVKGSAYSYLVQPSTVNASTVTCSYPAELFEPMADGTMIRDVSAGLYLVNPSQKRALSLNANSDYFSYTLKPCFSVQVEKEPCYGADASVTLVPSSNSDVVFDGSDSSITCQFVDDNEEDNVVYVTGTQTDLGSGQFECSTQYITEEGQCALTFKRFELLSNGVVVVSRQLSNTTSQCLQLSARSSSSDDFVESGQVSACWAQNNSELGAAILFTGSTALSLNAGYSQCRFSGGLPVAGNASSIYVDARTDSNTGGILCDIPDELFLGEGNGITSDVRAHLIYSCSGTDSSTYVSTIGNEGFALEVITGSPCLTSTVSELDSPVGDDVACMGSRDAKVFVDGGSSLESLLSELGNGSVECEFDTGETSEGTVQDTFVSCPLPATATLNSGRVTALLLERPAGSVAEYVSVNVSGYSLNGAGECLSNVIEVTAQSDDSSRRALQDSSDPSYCLGDGLATAFGGQTVVALLALYNETTEEYDDSSNETVSVLTQWACNWTIDSDWDASGGVQQTEAILQSDNSILCQSKVWSPFNLSSFNDGAYSSVTLVLLITDDAVGDPVDFESGYKAQVCSGDVSQGNGVSDSDADCARESVELVLGGRSAITLAKQSTQVFCSFDGPSGLEIADPLFNGGSSPSVECQAPGWDPKNTSSGNYTSIALYTQMDDGVTTKVVKSIELAPTAARICLDVTTPYEVCAGSAVSASVTGTSLSAYLSLSGSFSGTECLGSNAVSFEDTDSESEIVCSLSSSMTRAQLEETISVELDGVTLISSHTVQVKVAQNKASCLQSPYSYAQCSNSDAYTDVELSGSSLELLDLSSFICILSNTTTGAVVQTTPSKSYGNSTSAICSADNAYNVYSVVLVADKNVSLASGSVSMDNATCLSAAIIPPDSTSGGDGKSSSVGMIVGIVVAIVAVVLIAAALLVMRRRNQQKQLVVKADPDLEAAVPAKAIIIDNPAEGAKQEFNVGDRIEAQGDFALSGAEEAWHKGTIVSNHKDGLYSVHLDNVPLDQREQVVALGALRFARSDFAAGERVEAMYGAGRTWHGAVVSRVNPNDSYDLQYEDASLAPETFVAGGLVRSPLMTLEPGTVVEALHPEENRFLRAVISSRDIPAERYDVLFDPIGNSVEKMFPDQHQQNPEQAAAATVPMNRENVRLFVPMVGELVEVKEPEKDVVRGIVSSVDIGRSMCSLVHEDTAEKIANIPFAQVHRLAFVIGQTIEACQASVAGGNTGASSSDGDSSASAKVWIAARITKVSTSSDSYSVCFKDSNNDEDGVGVERIKRPPGLHEQDVNSTSSFTVGDQVVVLCNVEDASKSRDWRRAQVVDFNDKNETYKLKYLDDEHVEANVSIARLRELREPANDPIPDIFRPPQRDHEEMYGEDGQPIPYHMRFRKLKPLAYHELPNNQFDVTVDMTNGLGLSLGWTNDNRVIVAGFRDLPISGSWGPIEATGLVGLKDELMMVNDISVEGKSFVEVSELIKHSDKIIKLQFGRWDDEGPVSLGMQRGKDDSDSEE
eukprot:CAMPEP_0171572286 /NCGR_PEP_ID=MMETSP0961-20121227/4042_1 /TAXON_ID=87120 /ORGANISM="Aurantiochytrium limacinum, Strain ATCCMYA-1381" /LENGTH=2100 /DNA_ID=CAMNT_0012127123 /DNA_START=778 /DNA_END=7080 /DNA_ORIENTATION=+